MAVKWCTKRNLQTFSCNLLYIHMNFISIGGWCGTKIALKDLGLFIEPSLMKK